MATTRDAHANGSSGRSPRQVIARARTILSGTLGSRAVGRGATARGPVEPEQWPTRSWRVTTPEQQGMDSAALVGMVDAYLRKHERNDAVQLDSVTIVRKGAIVADLYFNPLFPTDTPHMIHSCTKSIVSALIGIAIEAGHLDGVDVAVLDVLGDKAPPHPDPRLRALTVEDLLTMQTGLRSRDSYLYQWRGLFELQTTRDWVRHILALPVEVLPGTRFDYSNMASFLLSAIVARSTGTDTLTFAHQHLFDPLGIADVRWETSPLGIHIGWARMWLRPRDMAKFGLLYLHRGRWDDRQVVPAHWVDASTTTHSHPERYRRFLDDQGRVDHRMSIGLWLITNLVRPFADGYGYQWWIDKRGLYTALGVSGQYIVVAPRHDLVAVFTSKLSGMDVFLPARLLHNHVLPAVVSDEPLPPNPTAAQRLVALSHAPEGVTEPAPVPPLPPTAERISGQTYRLERNPWRHDDFRLDFEPGAAHATFRYTVKDGIPVEYRIGLDGVHRLTASDGDTYAARGAWTAPDTLEIDYELIGYTNRGRWTLTFTDGEITVEESGVTGTYTYRGTQPEPRPR